jgi:hypothetical protein
MTERRTDWREPYFTDGDGREWHVYDCVKSDGRLRARKLASRRATVRVFVAEDRTRLVYAFNDGEPRELDARALEYQLKAAKNHEAWANTFQPVRRARR